MTDKVDPSRRPSPLSYPLEQNREQTMQSLERAFIDGILTHEEYDERLELATTARNQPELDVLLEDLPAAHTALVAPPKAELAPAAHDVPPMASGPSGPPETIFTFMGGHERDGQWSPPSRINAVALFGGVKLDFTAATLQPGVTEINCVAIMGGIEIFVPPGVRVENKGTGILGGFSTRLKGSDPQPGAPTIRISGVALMGGVDVRVKKSSRKLLESR